MQFILVVAVIVAVALFIFWPAFRTFVLDQATNIVEMLWHYGCLYLKISGIVLVIVAILVLSGMLISSPIYKGIVFVISAALVYVVWFPAGVTLRIFRVTEEVFPETVRAIASWICFVGFVGIVFPDFTSNLIVVLSAILLFGFYAGLSTQFDFLNRIAPIIVLLMLAWVGWKFIAPDSYRATTRFMAAKSDFLFAEADRNSVITEADAKATYGYLLKDISVAYKVTLRGDTISEISDMPASLKKDSLFLVVNHKRKNYAYDGQSFIEIKLPNKNGSYASGKKIWVEADLIRIDYRRKIDPALAQASPEPESTHASRSESCTLHEGEYWFTKHVFSPGEKFTYIVEYAALNNVKSDDSRVLLQPGTYSATMTSAGAPGFEGISERSKITIIY